MTARLTESTLKVREIPTAAGLTAKLLCLLDSVDVVVVQNQQTGSECAVLRVETLERLLSTHGKTAT